MTQLAVGEKVTVVRQDGTLTRTQVDMLWGDRFSWSRVMWGSRQVSGHTCFFADEGITWVLGHEGEQVEAFSAAIALAAD